MTLISDNIKYLRIGQSPFGVSMLIQKIALQILKQREKLEVLDDKIERSFDQIKRNLGQLVTRESRVPFYLLKTKIDSTEAERVLFKDGIAVVGGHKFRGLGNKYIRIALGTKEHNEYLVYCLSKRRII